MNVLQSMTKCKSVTSEAVDVNLVSWGLTKCVKPSKEVGLRSMNSTRETISWAGLALQRGRRLQRRVRCGEMEFQEWINAIVKCERTVMAEEYGRGGR